ncbi:MAG: hypothetical protein AMJ64_08975 [Betaproteobacteria bacterium SG8_39]|nr:MAG: hypothetical protein AMJ64_08975 [Betaproteobacteria bacterium SG8_39]
MRWVAALLLAGCAATASAQGFDHSHTAWSMLLKKHVVLISGGKASQFDYAGMAKDRPALKAYLQTLSGVPEAEFKGWSKPQRMAFLINAYNAFTVEKILTRYPDIGSIWDFGKIFGNPFKDDFFTLFGRAFTLDAIEHETLRKPGAYDEPRVHFAVNCASIGCPMLREEAYAAARLDAQLEEQTVRFLSDRSRNRYDAAQNRLEVSKIFDWFKADWQSGYRGFDGKTPPITSREAYFARYAERLADTPEARARIVAGTPSITFLEYDWSLNDVRR